MDAECRELWASIERKKERIVQSIERLTKGGQMSKPEGRAWSPNMLLEHLVLAEEVQNAEIEQGQVSKFEAVKRTNNFMRKMVLTVLRRGIRVPVPDAMTPAGKTETAELVARWNAARRKLFDLVDPVDPDALISKNPRLGWLSARDVLMITEAHLRYHERDLRQ